MSEQLERGLGLYSAVMLSMGAMIGGGIFVLPAVGFKKAGPMVIGAYLLAGLIVLPNALSKAEMATAMPADGGTYLYIDRAMGPLFGTIAGLGVWFSLVFKSSFALVGLGAYLILIVSIPLGLVKAVALGLGAIVIGLNIIGTEQSGQLQGIIVSIVVLGLAGYVMNGVTSITLGNYTPILTHDVSGFITATAFVFVSYAGIGEVASVAEEVTNPDRNLPLAMLISIGAMMVIYTAVVSVIVGLVPAETLIHGGPQGGPSLTPMADGIGTSLIVSIIALVAIFALTSMANAGVLGTSRFLLAMSRDSLLPEWIGRIDAHFLTPRNAVLLTGGVLLALIAFVPVIELAKLASAFLILVFSLENIALIAFRESQLDFYEPDFTAPGYPFVQLSGVAGGIVLIVHLGVVSILGAVAISIGGLCWYWLYGRSRTDRIGAIAFVIDRYAMRPSQPAEAHIHPARERK